MTRISHNDIRAGSMNIVEWVRHDIVNYLKFYHRNDAYCVSRAVMLKQMDGQLASRRTTTYTEVYFQLTDEEVIDMVLPRII